MKPLSSVGVSVVAYLGSLGRVQLNTTFCRKLSLNSVKFIEKTCFIRIFALILAV